MLGCGPIKVIGSESILINSGLKRALVCPHWLRGAEKARPHAVAIRRGFKDFDPANRNFQAASARLRPAAGPLPALGAQS